MICENDNEKTIFFKCLKHAILEDEFFRGKNTELVASTQSYMYRLDMDELHGMPRNYDNDAEHYITEYIRKIMKKGIIEGLNAIRLTKQFTNNYCKDEYYIERVTILTSYIIEELKNSSNQLGGL